MEPKPLGGQVLADDRHAQVRAVPAAAGGREGVTEMPRSISPPHDLAQQRLPLRIGQAATLPVGTRVLAAMVEESDVVVLLLQRADLPLDELVQLAEVVGQVRRDLEVDALSLRRPGVGELAQALEVHAGGDIAHRAADKILDLPAVPVTRLSRGARARPSRRAARSA